MGDGTWNNVQARGPVAESGVHDDSEAWSRPGVVPLLEWVDSRGRHIAGAIGGAKGADFSGS